MLNEVERLFLATTSKGFWQEVLRCLDHACAKAWEDAHAMYPREEAMTVYPILRRANVEAGLRMLAKRYPEITAEAALNRVGNCYHTELRMAHFLVTEAHVDEPGSSARPALYRDGIAETYQLCLDFNLDAETLVIDGTQAALLQYGEAHREPWRLSFAEVVFQDRSSRAIGRLDMVKHYAGAPVAEDTVEAIKPPVPQLRTTVRKEEIQA